MDTTVEDLQAKRQADLQQLADTEDELLRRQRFDALHAKLGDERELLWLLVRKWRRDLGQSDGGDDIDAGLIAHDLLPPLRAVAETLREAGAEFGVADEARGFDPDLTITDPPPPHDLLTYADAQIERIEKLRDGLEPA